MRTQKSKVQNQQRPQRVLDVFLGELGDLLRNTKLNGETAEAAEKDPSEALRSLRALRSNVVISFHGVCAAHDDSVVNVNLIHDDDRSNLVT